ncbi:MAG TPA: protein TolR [Luteimonas sp.]|nr:protein TolR [Luteimonas sp.]HRP73542.1 protein TolR [Luteimonas sp.]
MAGGIIHRKRRKLKSEINVVPYIDVMLVLLIIFMVTAPLLTLSVDVKLPSMNAKATQDQRNPIIVTARTDGRMGLQLEEGDMRFVEPAQLVEIMRPISEQQGDSLRVLVAGDRDVPYQQVVDVMEALRRANVTNVGLATQSAAGGDAR